MPNSFNKLEELTEKKCSSCEGELEKITTEQAQHLLKALTGWQLADEGKRIRKDWRMRDFMACMSFFSRVAELAEAEGHHPDLRLDGYRNVRIELSTHAIGGLSENDFIMAAKIDRLEDAK
jgi:4a-hydroxytetrahydrobiopterin dehydratase